VLGLLTLTMLSGCPPAPPVRAVFHPQGRQEPREQPAVAEDPVSGETRAVRVGMRSHFDSISEIKDAVIRGDEPMARDLARALAEDPDLLERQPGWAPHTQAVRDAAAAVAAAGSLVAIASATGVLGSRCGGCHSALGVEFDPATPPTPSRGTGVEASMAVHRWAVDRMWEGVVFPSEERWIRGSTMLVASPGCGDPSRETPVAELDPLCRRLQVVVRQGHDSAALDRRAQAYGHLLVTCARCHDRSTP
jgi:cytochrome c553